MFAAQNGCGDVRSFSGSRRDGGTKMRNVPKTLVVELASTSAHVSRLETAAATCACGLETAESTVECTADLRAAQR